MVGVIGRVGQVLRRALCKALAILMAIIVLLVCVQVCARYLGTPSFQAAEVSRIVFIWMTFIGSSLLISRRELIVLDLVHASAEGRRARFLAVLADLVTTVFLVVVGTNGQALMAITAQKVAPATGLSFGWFYSPLLAFCTLGLFFVLERTITRGSGAIAKHPTPSN